MFLTTKAPASEGGLYKSKRTPRKSLRSEGRSYSDGK